MYSEENAYLCTDFSSTEITKPWFYLILLIISLQINILSFILMKKVIRFLALFLSFLMVLNLNAVPVKPGLWKVITLEDGNKVLVEHRGDEWLHYLADKDGNVYLESHLENKQVHYQKITPKEFQSLQAKAKLKKGENVRFQRLFPTSPTNSLQDGPKRIGFKNPDLFQGTKKGLVILAEFSDVKFSDTYNKYGVENVNAFYQRVINEIGFNEAPFKGSVRDYFRKQSIRMNGEKVDGIDYQFDLDFDVVGPVTLSRNQAYYGAALYFKSGNTYKFEENDAHAGAMVYEAINLASDNYGIDFSQYDWDGDNEVDQVFVLYADKGQADGGGENTIWPHEWALSSSHYYERTYGNLYIRNSDGGYEKNVIDENFKGSITKNGYKINTYACSNEMASVMQRNSNNEYTLIDTKINGIGTICHEFSHCLGYPDSYDTAYSGNYGMGAWDLMAAGSYNGDNCGYCPAGYTSFERWAAGWISPIVLSDPQVITNMGSLQSTAQAYIVYARGSDKTGQYYLLENREYEAWDYSLPWSGLLILFVDYQKDAWSSNVVNTTTDTSNDHQRYTVFHADRDEAGFVNWPTYPYEPEFWLPIAFKSNTNVNTLSGDKIAEYFNTKYQSDGVNLGTQFNNSLTPDSDPKAIYYHNKTNSSSVTLGNNTSEVFNNHEIHHITKNQDGTVNFIYRYPTVPELTLNDDATTQEEFSASTYKTVTLNRSFEANKWNTLWLPFSLSPTEVRQAFGNDAQVALFNGSTTEKTDEGTTVSIKFTRRVNSLDTELTQGTKAFEPFLIRVQNEVVNPVFEYVTISQNSDTEAQLTKNGWTFVGTDAICKIPEGSYFISGDTFYKSLGNSNTKAYRGYFTPSSIDAQTLNDASLIKRQFENVVDDHETVIMESKMMERYDFMKFLTSINDVIDEEKGEAPRHLPGIYSLSGQLVSDSASSVSSLPRGIYLVNGKKYIVK